MGIVCDYNNCGSRSSFYVIDDKRGFKEFEDKREAEYAHKVQSELAKNNLAPQVFSEVGKIRYRDNLELSRWGYITEIAEMVSCGGNECMCGECDYIWENKRMDKKVYRLCSGIAELGFEFVDAHIGNVGYVQRRGKKVLVCIDCGMESVFDNMEDEDCDDNPCSCYVCRKLRNKNV